MLVHSYYYGVSFSEQRTVQKCILTSLGSGKSIYIRETVNLPQRQCQVERCYLYPCGVTWVAVGGGQSCHFGFQVSFCVHIYPIFSTPHSFIPPKSRSPFSIPLTKNGTKTGGKPWNHDDTLGWRQGLTEQSRDLRKAVHLILLMWCTASTECMVCSVNAVHQSPGEVSSLCLMNPTASFF